MARGDETEAIPYFSFVFGIKHCAWHQIVLSDNYMHIRLVSKCPYFIISIML